MRRKKKKSGAMPMLACEYEDKKITTNYFQGWRKRSEGRSTWDQCSSRRASSSPSRRTPMQPLSNRRRCPQATTAPVRPPNSSRWSHSATASMAEEESTHCFATEASASEERVQIDERNVSPAGVYAAGPCRRIFSDDPVTLKSCLWGWVFSSFLSLLIPW